MNFNINATKLDSGEYYCEVTNGVEYIASPTAYINVLGEHSIPKTFIAVPLFLKILRTLTFPLRTANRPISLY